MGVFARTPVSANAKKSTDEEKPHEKFGNSYLIRQLYGMKNDEFVREIAYYKNYYLDFFNKLKPEVKTKFNWTLKLIATLDRVPEKYFRHITNSTGIFEIRVEVQSKIFRAFSFFDKG